MTNGTIGPPPDVLVQALRELTDAVLVTDAEQRIVFANDAFANITGFDTSEVVGRNCRFLQGPGTDSATVAVMRTALSGRSAFRGEVLNYRKDGSSFWNLVTITPIRGADAEVEHFVSVQRDVTEEVLRRRESEVAYAEAVRQRESRDLLLDVARRLGEATSSDALAATMSEAVRILTGSDRAALGIWDETASRLRIAGARGFEGPVANLESGFVLSPSSSSELAELLVEPTPRLITESTSAPSRATLRLFGSSALVAVPVHAHGRLRGVLLAIWSSVSAPDRISPDLAERLTGLAGLALVGFEIVRLIDTVRRAAERDALTGLLNRSAFERALTVALQRREEGELVAVLFADVDRFKRVNDALGHGVGDEVLRTVARIVRSAVRDDDVVGRIGGDELVVILTGLRRGVEAQAVVDRIAEQLERPIDASGQDVYIRLSIGLATSEQIGGASDPGEAAAALLRRADADMYRIKDVRSAARAPAMASDLLALDAELHGAAERGEFRVLFQPLVDVRTRRVVCHEALVRWAHPRKGLLLPGAFLPLAEDNGIMGEIDAAVLAEAARFVTGAVRIGEDPSVSVNVSPRRMSWRDLIEQVTALFGSEESSLRRLTLELTESHLAADASDAQRQLTHLRDLGVNIAIDDFGTGYSSLSQLQDFPVTELKIDRSFVHRAGVLGIGLIRTMVLLAQDLGLRIVAEGVETEGQCTMLMAAGCDRMQGYLFGRPVPLEEALSDLETHRIVNRLPAEEPDRP
jgi:diguanylate cyclase (GGDEF)-like protein/PAS domain S-box-containing protein